MTERKWPAPQPWIALGPDLWPVPADLPRGPCVLQGMGPQGVWVTRSRHRSGVEAWRERARLRLWPNRILGVHEVAQAVRRVQDKPVAAPAPKRAVVQPDRPAQRGRAPWAWSTPDPRKK